MTAPAHTKAAAEVRALGTLLAGMVDGEVDILAEYVITSPWLAAHDAQVAAHAWTEGHRVGWEHGQDGNYGTDYWDDDTPNPYRADAMTRQADAPAADDEGGQE